MLPLGLRDHVDEAVGLHLLPEGEDLLELRRGEGGRRGPGGAAVAVVDDVDPFTAEPALDEPRVELERERLRHPHLLERLGIGADLGERLRRLVRVEAGLLEERLVVVEDRLRHVEHGRVEDALHGVVVPHRLRGVQRRQAQPGCRHAGLSRHDGLAVDHGLHLVVLDVGAGRELLRGDALQVLGQHLVVGLAHELGLHGDLGLALVVRGGHLGEGVLALAGERVPEGHLDAALAGVVAGQRLDRAVGCRDRAPGVGVGARLLRTAAARRGRDREHRDQRDRRDRLEGTAHGWLLRYGTWVQPFTAPAVSPRTI